MNNKHLVASENMFLTNGEVYATELWLGDWDSPDNWWEVTCEEVEAIRAAEMPEPPEFE